MPINKGFLEARSDCPSLNNSSYSSFPESGHPSSRNTINPCVSRRKLIAAGIGVAAFSCYHRFGNPFDAVLTSGYWVPFLSGKPVGRTSVKPLLNIQDLTL
jgi:hypothetical protein